MWSTMVISMTTDHDFPDKGRKLISVRNSKNSIGLSPCDASRILSWKGLFRSNCLIKPFPFADKETGSERLNTLPKGSLCCGICSRSSVYSVSSCLLFYMASFRYIPLDHKLHKDRNHVCLVNVIPVPTIGPKYFLSEWIKC